MLKNHKTFLSLGFLAFALLLSVSVLARVIPANDTTFHYQGRIDFSNSSAPVVVWQASIVAIEFSGPKLQLGFSGLEGQAYFDAEIDGVTYLLKGQNGWIESPVKLDDGWHSITLFKRNEASTGHIAFKGIKIDNREKTKRPQTKDYTTRFIFYGDSITVGACNEDEPTADQWSDYSTHNNAKSYATLVANAFDADFRNIAISGIGISVGYQPYTVDKVWNRYYPDPTSEIAKPSYFKPDVVFVNYGENDDSFSKNNNMEFPADYASRYIEQVKRLRTTYPNSKIVILRGGMYGGAKSERLIKPWEKVVAALEATDENIYHYVFKHWHNLHPRVKNHKIMADELVVWLKQKNWF